MRLGLWNGVGRAGLRRRGSRFTRVASERDEAEIEGVKVAVQFVRKSSNAERITPVSVPQESAGRSARKRVSNGARELCRFHCNGRTADQLHAGVGPGGEKTKRSKGELRQ